VFQVGASWYAVPVRIIALRTVSRDYPFDFDPMSLTVTEVPIK
jgi:hypothetical protein